MTKSGESGELFIRLQRTSAAATAADEAAKDARASRNHVIREALDQGWTVSRVARATGLAPSTISRLLPGLYEGGD